MLSLKRNKGLRLCSKLAREDLFWKEVLSNSNEFGLSKTSTFQRKGFEKEPGVDYGLPCFATFLYFANSGVSTKKIRSSGIVISSMAVSGKWWQKKKTIKRVTV